MQTGDRANVPCYPFGANPRSWQQLPATILRVFSTVRTEAGGQLCEVHFDNALPGVNCYRWVEPNYLIGRKA